MTMLIRKHISCGRPLAEGEGGSAIAVSCTGRVAGIAKNAGRRATEPCQPLWQSMGAFAGPGEFAQLAQFPLPLVATQSAALAAAGSDGRPTPPRVKIASASAAL